MKELLQPGFHPDADQLNAFIERTLSANEKQQTLAHLAVCPDCRTIVALSLPPIYQPPRAPGWRLAWFAVPALAALAVVVIYFRSEVAKPTPVRAPIASAPPVSIPTPAAPREPAPIRHKSPRMLPSLLPVLSRAENGRERLAIDTAHSVFFSSDNGRHWKAVPSQWSGRAVRVSLVLADVAQTPQVEVVTGAVQLRQRADSVEPSLSGTITDKIGAAIPKVSIILTDTHDAVVRETITDSAGHYRIDNLAAGTYQVAAEGPGFSKRSVRVEIASGYQGTANLTLEVGTSSQTVEVTAAAPAVPLTDPAAAFEITTDTGDLWTSTDGRTWKHK